MATTETFSVYSTETEDGKYTPQINGDAAEPAVRLAKLLIDSGLYFHIWIVCDQDDTTVFDWNKRDGLVFPPLPKEGA